MTMGIRTANADGTRARGGSNGNERGGSETRRKRREWLVATYRADMDVLIVDIGRHVPEPYLVPIERGWENRDDLSPDLTILPACRCYRCGQLLTVDTVSADRIKPGCQGGTYRRENIRPACYRCNSVTGATTRRTTR